MGKTHAHGLFPTFIWVLQGKKKKKARKEEEPDF
jgi:hypothetical protein